MDDLNEEMGVSESSSTSTETEDWFSTEESFEAPSVGTGDGEVEELVEVGDTGEEEFSFVKVLPTLFMITLGIAQYLF